MLQKTEAAEERLTTVLTKPVRKARCPSKEGAAVLEITATKSPYKALRYAAGVFGYLLGASARFDDGQHYEEERMSKIGEYLEGRAWQCKTVGPKDNSTRILPLTCPLVTISGEPWWERFWALHQELRAGE